MGFSHFISIQWAAAAAAEVVLFALALRRNLFRRLPLFTIYLGLLLLNEAVLWLTYRLTGISSRASFDAYWIMQSTLLLARAAAVYDICRALLSPYAGVWKFCRPILAGVALFLAVGAAISVGNSSPRIAALILTGERGLESVIFGILLCGLMFCRYYGVSVSRHIAWLALGLGFYSAVQFVNNTFLRLQISGRYFEPWRDLRLVSFDIAIVLWWVALLKPLPQEQTAPVLFEPGEYEAIVPQMTSRLRQLNSTLLEMWK